jgi:hypothetical protein
MEHAITTLYVALHTMERNEPINRDEGNFTQAEYEKEAARQFRKAIDVLQRHKDADTITGE